MQVFLPLASIADTVKVLDYRRLGKMRVEAFQLHKIVSGIDTSSSWKNHPAAKMLSGHPDFIAHYMNSCINEWKLRGYKNTMQLIDTPKEIIYPPWFGDEEFHSSHRAALLFKNYEYYSKFNWTESPLLDYVWPTVEQPL